MAARPRLTLIAAVAQNGIIGLNNAMPWRLPEDLKRFKALTLGHPIIMGRKTWTSLGRPLPGRSNIVITRDRDFRAPCCIVVDSLAAALDACAGEKEAFVIGGADIYALALPMAQQLQITEIRRNFDGDTYFPAIDPDTWRAIERESHRDADGLAYDFVTYERLPPLPSSHRSGWPGQGKG